MESYSYRMFLNPSIRWKISNVSRSELESHDGRRSRLAGHHGPNQMGAASPDKSLAGAALCETKKKNHKTQNTQTQKKGRRLGMYVNAISEKPPLTYLG